MTQEVSTDGPVELGRRRVLLGMGGAGLAGVLVACGGDDEPPAPDQDEATPTPGDETTTPDDDDQDDDDQDDDDQDDDDDDAQALASTADVPVGAGVIVAGQGVVITQPSEGEFRAFSSTCTHQGCTVGDVADRLIRCPCHGSRFSIDDGSVENGPATSPLPEVSITVDGDQILRA